MNMLAIILRLRPIDQVLVWLYILYAVFIMASLAYVDREYIRRDFRRWLNGKAIRAETFRSWVKEYDYDMDPSWMGYEQWKEERRHGRLH